MLAAENLAAMRGDRTLFSAITFALAAGEILEVAGANGSGKTTLLRVLSGLLQPTQGAVRWRDEDIRALREDFYSELTYVGHLNAVKDEFTPLENLHFSAALRGPAPPAQQLTQTLSELGLTRQQQRLPSKVLSQGQKRRVALARALFGSAKLWILDEPFAALDVAAIDFVAQRCGEHCARGGLLVFSSHQDVAIASVRRQTLRLGVAQGARAA